MDFLVQHLYTGIPYREEGKSSRILKACNVSCLAKLNFLLGPIICIYLAKKSIRFRIVVFYRLNLRIKNEETCLSFYFFSVFFLYI